MVSPSRSAQQDHPELGYNNGTALSAMQNTYMASYEDYLVPVNISSRLPIPPLPFEADATESSVKSPYRPDFPLETAVTVRRERCHVRFNSNSAASNSPNITSEPTTRMQERQNTSSPKPSPSILRASSSGSIPTVSNLGLDLDNDTEKTISAVAAQERAMQMAARLNDDSSTGSRISMDSSATKAAGDSGEGSGNNDTSVPLQGSSSDDDSQIYTIEKQHTKQLTPIRESLLLVRAHSSQLQPIGARTFSGNDGTLHASDSWKEPSDRNCGNVDDLYDIPPPQQYRGNVLSQLLKLYKSVDVGKHIGQPRNWSDSSLGKPAASESGTATPNSARRKWYEANRSQDTLANLIEASTRLANPSEHGSDTIEIKSLRKIPKSSAKRVTDSSHSSGFWQKEESRIAVHIAETLSRQQYIIKLCRALMIYGAPTHRLEEYLATTARFLEIDGQFLYLPGCMLVSFDDKSTHTTEVRIVRAIQGIDLGKLKDVHQNYKEVLHDVIDVDEGIHRLDELMNAKDKFRNWFRVLVYGLTSAACAPFSFSARLIDLPISFCFGCLVGVLQLIVASRSKMYSNVLEVTATVVVSFLARAFGSIRGGDLFCFSALAQSGIVMLLPGFTVLCSALELQSRAIVPGSIRIVFAIIYSVLLGFGITVGAALYGLFDPGASSATTCRNPMPSVYTFAFVPIFALCLSILNQAKWRQMPMMVFIAFTGYIVNFFSSLKFVASPQIANTLGALAVGILANLYSRLRHGVAAASLIPAIFVQVPGGLASTGGLLSGLQTANHLTNSTQIINGTNTVRFNEGDNLDTVVFNVAASMIQIAIGIAVGLFLSAVLVYPLGKERSGLFSF